MDFIDDFIQEYKNNPCLWKADSTHFKNRTKRQEAYMKLIEVASKHGEHYNIERTKQKINNLRCAFRHQLKKYIEFKNKGEKDEPYTPKRRYFESLMFLKDEESPYKKQEISCPTQTTDYVKTLVEPESGTDLLESTVFNKDTIVEFTTTDSVNTTDDHSIKVINNEMIKPSNKILNSIKSPIMEREAIITAAGNVIEYDDEKSIHISQETIQLSPTLAKDNMEQQIYDFDKESTSNRHKKRNNCRKRSSSVSSQLSNETELVSTKTVKLDFTSMDFEKLFSLACKSIQCNMDDHFSNFGKVIAHKLRSMEPTQAIYAEKIIADVLFQGQMKLLSALNVNQFLSVDCTNSFGDLQPNK